MHRWNYVFISPIFFFRYCLGFPSEFKKNIFISFLKTSLNVMGITILNSCRWSGGNKTPGVNLVITRFHKILLITLGHINVLHEDITYIQYYMAKWSYIIKNIKTYQQFSLWTMIIFNKLLHYKKIGDHSF